MVKVGRLLIEAESVLRLSFGVRAQTEMKIWCIKGMFLLKVVSSENNLGFKGIYIIIIIKQKSAHSGGRDEILQHRKKLEL